MVKRGDSRGLSTIVATLLVILLTLVAVGIIWVVVRNVINQGAEQVSLGKFTLNLEIKSVGIDPATPNFFSLRIKRNAGEGEINGLKFIVDDGDTTEVVELNNYSLKELEERVINISLSSITNASNIKTVSVAPIFKLESGKEITGDVKDEYDVPKTSISAAVPCTPFCTGRNCGSNGCGGICGTCSSGYTCQISNGTCMINACTAETNTAFCLRLSKNCGSVTALDNCGDSRTVASCGTCTLPQTCGGGGTVNVCGSPACTAETNTAFCLRLSKNCGSVTALDNCGDSRTVASCGTCTLPQTCGGGGTVNVCGSSAPTWTWTDELLTNGGFEDGDLTGWNEDNGDYGQGFTVGNHMGNYEYILPQSGSYQAWANGASSMDSGVDFYLFQDINLEDYASCIDSGNAVINVSGWGATSEKTGGADTTRIQFYFADASWDWLEMTVDSDWIYWVNGTWWNRTINNHLIPENARYLVVWASSYEECNGNVYCDSGSWDSFSAKLGCRS